MTQRLQDWTLPERLRAIPAVLRAAMDREGAETLSAVERAAPKRTGRLSRSFRLRSRGRDREVTSDHPGALFIASGGSIRALNGSGLVFGLRPGYTPGAAGYVTLPSSGGARVIVSADRAGDRIVALHVREVRQRGSQYLRRAAVVERRAGPSRLAQRVASHLVGG